MKPTTLAFWTPVVLLGALLIPVLPAAQAAKSELMNFDAPGAGQAGDTGQGTFPECISDAGAITGRYVDANNVSHGFLRSPDGGGYITFDAPGAGKTAGSGQGTFPESINHAGAITGHYIDANNLSHGFLRSPAADLFVTFDTPAAGKMAGSRQGTFPESISRTGAVAGHYVDANNVSHGFLRTP